MEGDNGDMMQSELCIILQNVAGGLEREANFRLSSISGSAGESVISMFIILLCMHIRTRTSHCKRK